MSMYRTIRIDFKAYGDKHSNVVMLSVMSNLTRAFLLNYPEFPEGCTVQGMRALSSGYVMDISMQSARYQIQIQIDYYKEA